VPTEATDKALHEKAAEKSAALFYFNIERLDRADGIHT
jgi:hypothetical protein